MICFASERLVEALLPRKTPKDGFDKLHDGIQSCHPRASDAIPPSDLVVDEIRDNPAERDVKNLDEEYVTLKKDGAEPLLIGGRPRLRPYALAPAPSLDRYDIASASLTCPKSS